MQVTPESINISSLPWLPLSAKSAFPRQPAIYFAIDSENEIQYIGRSLNPKQRWGNHHRFDDLIAIGQIKIAYLFVDAAELLPEVEVALIEWFNPPLNIVGKSDDKDVEIQQPRGGMKNKISQLIDSLGISAYRFAEETGITKNTVYLLKNNPDQFPSGEVFDRIIAKYRFFPNDIVEWVPGEKNE